MTDLPEKWQVYLRLQERLASRPEVDDYSWGLEASLNRVLAEELLSAEDSDRSVRSESRKQRHQAQLRRKYAATQELSSHPDHVLEARLSLRLLKSLITPEEFSLLRAVGEGYDYGEIASANKVAAGTLRARVLRVRRKHVAIAR
jgi:DNA-binding NarL/FixJ family response regulator